MTKQAEQFLDDMVQSIVSTEAENARLHSEVERLKEDNARLREQVDAYELYRRAVEAMERG